MTEENSMSNWFQDNLRIIISVGIVILLIFAIYSYSKRNSRTEVVVDDSQIEEIAMTAGDGSSDEINEIIDEIKDEDMQEAKVDSIEVTSTETTDTEVDTSTEAKVALEAEAEQLAKEEAQKAKIALEQKAAEAAQAIEEKKLSEESQIQEDESQAAKEIVREVIESRSRQKEGVIVVVAVPGDSQTTLARKAAASYIVQNNVGGLTPAHKIYIEDYVRKAKQATRIHPGTEMEFSNDLINNAIESSRTLSSAQLSNLDKYVANVSSL